MESFVVSARKYRPDNFSSVVGQDHITNTLRNALLNNMLAHAFLFCGPRGVGKTTCARILAKAVNCSQITPEGDPCNACDSCVSFNQARSLNIFEMDAASNNGVEDIRNLVERVRFIPQQGSKSVYIIDEVHMLSNAAFNAFLKTLEEPPPHAIFILATTEKHKILPTILSRCQKFDFRRIRVEDIAKRLEYIAKEEEIQYEQEALHLIALKADGGLRDALSIFDQIVNFSNRNVQYSIVLENLNVLDYDYYFQVIDSMIDGDHGKVLTLFNSILEKGFDSYSFLSGILEHVRNLLIGQDIRTLDILDVAPSVKQRYIDQSKTFPATLLLNVFNLIAEAEQKYRTVNNTRLLVELTLIKLVHLPTALNVVIESTDPIKKKVA